MKADIEKLKKLISPIAEKHGVAKIWLFGSYARNEANESSDIDLLIEKGKLETYIDIFRFQYEIEKCFNKSVDIVTTEAIQNEYFLLKNIKKNSILIYENTSFATGERSL